MTKKLLTALLTLTLGLFFFTACADKTAENGENSENPADIEIPESDPGAANYVIINVRDFGEITVRLHPEYAPNTVERFVENVRSGFYTGRNFHRIMEDFMIQGGSFDGQGAGDPAAEGVFTETHPDARHYYGAFCLAANHLGFGSDSFYIVNNKDTQVIENMKENIIAMLEYYFMMLTDIAENEEAYVEEVGRETVDASFEYWSDMASRTMEQLEELENMPEEVRQRYAEVGGVPFLDGGYTVFGYTIDGFDVIDAISAVEVVNNGVGEISRPTQEIIIEWIIVKTTLE
jgi:peptidyl-prolyl cis-trans isomerase A (cyclophilin A)/peptidyl-prolyl cis-trans isomerase B (cyclophilin B)